MPKSKPGSLKEYEGITPAEAKALSKASINWRTIIQEALDWGVPPRAKEGETNAQIEIAHPLNEHFNDDLIEKIERLLNQMGWESRYIGTSDRNQCACIFVVHW